MPADAGAGSSQAASGALVLLTCIWTGDDPWTGDDKQQSGTVALQPSLIVAIEAEDPGGQEPKCRIFMTGMEDPYVVRGSVRELCDKLTPERVFDHTQPIAPPGAVPACAHCGMAIRDGVRRCHGCGNIWLGHGVKRYPNVLHETGTPPR